MNLQRPDNYLKQRGLSMIELMVALVIGLLLTAGVLQMFVSSKATYTLQSELAKMQENARFAVEFMARDLRMAGYMGCSKNTTMANTLRDSGGTVYAQYDLSSPVSLEDNYVTADGTSIPLPTGASPLAGSDIISVKFADGEGSCSIKDVPSESSVTIRCNSPHDFQKGEILLVSDCKQSAIFQMTNNGGNSSEVNHSDNNGSVSPGNCTKSLGFPENKPTPFKDGTIQRYRNYTYYIANNNFGTQSQPALFRSAISVSSGTAGLEAQELVEGVEDMQLTYGIDTDDDGDADTYISAATAIDVTEVVAIRINLLMRSLSDNVVNTAQTYSYNGVSVTATDRRLRKVFTSTITLRNRVI